MSSLLTKIARSRISFKGKRLRPVRKPDAGTVVTTARGRGRGVGPAKGQAPATSRFKVGLGWTTPGIESGSASPKGITAYKSALVDKNKTKLRRIAESAKKATLRGKKVPELSAKNPHIRARAELGVRRAQESLKTPKPAPKAAPKTTSSIPKSTRGNKVYKTPVGRAKFNNPKVAPIKNLTTYKGPASANASKKSFFKAHPKALVGSGLAGLGVAGTAAYLRHRQKKRQQETA